MTAKRHPVTASDIAKLVGVCRQAVSSTLTGRGNSKVSEDKRREIIRLADELGYRSNISALQLAGHRTYTIGLVSTVHSLNGELNAMIAQKISQHGYKLVQMNADKDHLRQTMEELVAHGAEGIICSEKPQYDRKKFPVPILQISHDNSDVDIDHENAGYQVGRHLLRHGHRKILILDGFSGNANSSREYAGIKRAGSDGVELKHIYLFRNPDGNRQVLDAIRSGFSGIFCTYDNYGWRLLTFLRQHGVRVPEDAAVIGFGGHAINEYMSPSLSSVIYPVHELADAAVSRMVEKIDSGNYEKFEKEYLIRPKLNTGGSCGCEERQLKNIYWEGNFVSIEAAYKYIEAPPEQLQDIYTQITEE